METENVKQTPKFERRERPTIMSGQVHDFAVEFREVDGIVGKYYEALGPFRVSASRDAVMVHRADCRTAGEVEALIACLQAAEQSRQELAGQR